MLWKKIYRQNWVKLVAKQLLPSANTMPDKRAKSKPMFGLLCVFSCVQTWLWTWAFLSLLRQHPSISTIFSLSRKLLYYFFISLSLFPHRNTQAYWTSTIKKAQRTRRARAKQSTEALRGKGGGVNGWDVCLSNDEMSTNLFANKSLFRSTICRFSLTCVLKIKI